jgi:uncharacterized membrane protein HdeD (DUF308 family)
MAENEGGRAQSAPIPEHRSRAMMLVSGVLALIAGAGAIVVPAAAGVAIELLVGWVLVFGSILILSTPSPVAASRGSRSRSCWRWRRSQPAYTCSRPPLVGLFTMTVMLVIWFVAIGFTELAAGIAEWGSPGAGALAASGVLSLVLGFLVANRLPDSAVWAIVCSSGST